MLMRVHQLYPHINPSSILERKPPQAMHDLGNCIDRFCLQLIGFSGAWQLNLHVNQKLWVPILESFEPKSR
jgi:hypothetical protein